ncbi:MAG: hypothetical protein GF381_00535 [Candidatus Pacebacteria bacterium]|nr:hypothetical protein [Candidatus Paceibacterota bacterium]
MPSYEKFEGKSKGLHLAGLSGLLTLLLSISCCFSQVLKPDHSKQQLEQELQKNPIPTEAQVGRNQMTNSEQKDDHQYREVEALIQQALSASNQ